MTQYWKCFTSLFCLPNFLVRENFLIGKLKGNIASQPKRVEEFENIFPSIVKFRRTLVQLKQFKKIKHLQECNFPHFTSKSKYQSKSSYLKIWIVTQYSCLYSFHFYLTQVQSLSCLVSHWARPLVKFWANCWICQSGFDKSINGFLQVIALICQNDIWIGYMDLSKLLNGFVLILAWICHSC